jgi:hypothetical protein
MTIWNSANKGVMPRGVELTENVMFGKDHDKERWCKLLSEPSAK